MRPAWPAPYVFSGHYEALKPSVAFEFLQEPSVGQVALAFLQASFAYSGWNFLNYVTEEVVEPRKYVTPSCTNAWVLQKLNLCRGNCCTRAVHPPVINQCLKCSTSSLADVTGKSKKCSQAVFRWHLKKPYVLTPLGTFLVPSTFLSHWWPSSTPWRTSPTSPPWPQRSCWHPML